MPSVSGRGLLVHWFFTPDSYDTWLEEMECDAEPHAYTQPNGPWQVRLDRVSVCLVTVLARARCSGLLSWQVYNSGREWLTRILN